MMMGKQFLSSTVKMSYRTLLVVVVAFVVVAAVSQQNTGYQVQAQEDVVEPVDSTQPGASVSPAADDDYNSTTKPPFIPGAPLHPGHKCQDYDGAYPLPFNLSQVIVDFLSDVAEDVDKTATDPTAGYDDDDDDDDATVVFANYPEVYDLRQILDVFVVQLDIVCADSFDDDRRKNNAYRNVPKQIQFHLYVVPPNDDEDGDDDDDGNSSSRGQPRWNCYPPNFARPMLEIGEPFSHQPLLEINQTYVRPHGLYFAYSDTYNGGSGVGDNTTVPFDANGGTIELWLPASVFERVPVLAPRFDHSVDINTIPLSSDSTTTTGTATGGSGVGIDDDSNNYPQHLTVWNIGAGTQLSINTTSSLNLIDQSLFSEYQVSLLDYDDLVNNNVVDDESTTASNSSSSIISDTSFTSTRSEGGSDNENRRRRHLQFGNTQNGDKNSIWTRGSNSKLIIERTTADDDLNLFLGGFQQTVYFTGGFDTIVVNGTSIDIMTTDEQDAIYKDGFCDQIIYTETSVLLDTAGGRNSTCSVWNDSMIATMDQQNASFPVWTKPPCLSSTRPETFYCLKSAGTPPRLNVAVLRRNFQTIVAVSVVGFFSISVLIEWII